MANKIETKTIAVLMTCYNRKPDTLDCLSRLFSQILAEDVSFKVYLVDDSSTDGTASAISNTYPAVQIIQGGGDLFWNRGMRLAFSIAMQHDFDYYLWLNDDTLLYPKALQTLLSTMQSLREKGEHYAIVTGATQDSESSAFTYGGVRKGKGWHPFQFQPIEPGTTPQPCDTMNGNCVLIPRSVVQRVGNLDSKFHHYIGDYDYGLRAKQQNCSVWIAPGYVGTCAMNPAYQSKVYSKVTRKQIKQLSHPKGITLGGVILYSFQEWFVFTKRHGGPFWPFYWLLPYRRLIRLLVST
jgi:GT2 family glycosyltransferase